MAITLAFQLNLAKCACVTLTSNFMQHVNKINFFKQKEPRDKTYKNALLACIKYEESESKEFRL